MKPSVLARRLISIVIAGSAVAGSIALAPAATALQRGQTLSALKAAGHAAIARRLTLLSALTTRVTNAEHVSSSNRSTLLGQLSAAKSGLQALDSAISADATLAELRPDLHAIVDDYRVYVLVAPKVHLVLAAGRISDLTGLFDAVATKIQKAIDDAKAAGKDTAAAEAALADLKAKVAAARGAATGVAASVLPLTAGGYPGNRATLLSARDALRTARTDLRAARSDARNAIAALK
jgi:hypothetical protein